MSIMNFMFQTLIIVAMLAIINSTFIAYLYITYKYKTIDKFFLSWVTMSTMILIMWFGGMIVSVSTKYSLGVE